MLKDAYYAGMSGLARAQDHRPVGTPIWSDDWDICIILDSCRADLLSEYYQNVEARWSMGSVTTEWLSNTFHESQDYDPSDVAYVSATPHSDTVFRQKHVLTNQDDVRIPFPEARVPDPDSFDAFYELWESHATEHDAVPPAVMRAATLQAYQRHDRVVAHWLQPHEPFIDDNARLVGGAATESNVWTALQQGELDKEDVWQSYKANLELALGELERLLRSVDATVLVTADHGNAFGELGVYGHPYGWPQPAVRRVPWMKREAIDVTTKPPEPVLDDKKRSSVGIESQLEALGYQ